MDHAEARAWLDDAFFRRGALAEILDAHAGADLSSEPAAEDRRAAVVEHLARCADCMADAVELRHTAVALDLVRGPAPALRERVLTGVRDVGRPRGTPPATDASSQPARESQSGSHSAWLLRAAAVVAGVAVLAGLLGAAWGMATRPDSRNAERLAAAVAMLAELADDPATQSLQLTDPSGAEAGSVFLSDASGRLAVFSSALDPATGEYSCYLEREGVRTEIGPMHFAGNAAFWAGPIRDAAGIGEPGDRFVVARDASSPAALSATF